MRDGVSRVQADGLAKHFVCLVQPATNPQTVAEIGKSPGMVRVKSKRRSVGIDRGIVGRDPFWRHPLVPLHSCPSSQGSAQVVVIRAIGWTTLYGLLVALNHPVQLIARGIRVALAETAVVPGSGRLELGRTLQRSTGSSQVPHTLQGVAETVVCWGGVLFDADGVLERLNGLIEVSSVIVNVADLER